MLDIKITNAKTRKTGKELVEIGIENGKITAIAPSVEGEAKQVIDAKGKLVTESFVNGHLHLCKVYTLEMAGQDALKEYNDNNMGGAMTSIERAADFKACYDEKWIIENVRKACDLAVKYGNTHIRAFADVDSKARLEGVKAVIRGREEYKDRLDIQVVAFPQDGVAREPGAKELIKDALKKAKVKGRIEMVKVSDDFTLMIDYAHNAMSLESLLTTLKEYHPKRLVCLFGCGGNRSRDRRFEMGEVSGRLADLTIITSDNPRFEEPQAIIDDIKVGMAKTKGKYVEISDRKEAIRYVIEHGQKGDVIVLAGKGHEDYQEIKGVKYPMDERVLIQEILKEMAEK